VGYALEIDDLTKRFGAVTAVDRLSLRIEEGTLVGLLGRNGAGKSTTINLATGLLSPSSGRIRVLGLDLGRHPLDVKRQIGVMPQDEGQLDCLTGRQYLHFVGRVYGLEDAVIDRRSRELLELLELEAAPRALIRDYSGGMRKKLALSAALIHGPRMVFLDEPFEGIDPLTSRTIKDILVGLKRKGVTVLMSSHMLEVVEKICPLIAIVDRGRLLGCGSLAQLREQLERGGSLDSLFVDLLGGARPGELSWL
jgi:ABC-2 type transport system ATP-binding protein